MIDRKRIHIAVGRVLTVTTHYPRDVQARLLGQNMGPLIAAVTDSVMAELEKE